MVPRGGKKFLYMTSENKAGAILFYSILPNKSVCLEMQEVGHFKVSLYD